MAEYLIQDTTLDAIADAINAKTGGSSAMTPAEMVTAIGSISGGGEQGLHDVSFNYSDGTRSWSGIVENNIIKNFSANTFCGAPLWLKHPIAIATNDVLRMSISSTIPYFDAGIINPFISNAGRDLGNISIAFNKRSGTYSMTYTGDNIVIDRLFFYPRTASAVNDTAEIHFWVNDVQII